MGYPCVSNGSFYKQKCTPLQALVEGGAGLAKITRLRAIIPRHARHRAAL